MAKGLEKMNIFRSLEVAGKVLKMGIGMSKRAVYKANNGTSPFVHSYSTYNRYMGVAKEFANWVREQGINRVDKLTYEHARDFLQEKVKQGLSEKTIKVNTSALEKYFTAIGRSDIASQLRENFNSFWTQASPSGQTLGFANPNAMIEKLSEKNTLFGDIAKIQYYTGARIGDVKKVEVNLEAKTVEISGSKGGRDRSLDFSDRVEKLEQVKEAVDNLKEYLNNGGNWSELRKEYTEAVRDTANQLGETYTGTHAFRVNYASERYKELTEKYGQEYADKELTKELGHNRISMSRYYANK